MSNVLVRGLPLKVHRQIQRLAEEQNLSSNQLIIKLLVQATKRANEEQEEEVTRENVFQKVSCVISYPLTWLC